MIEFFIFLWVLALLADNEKEKQEKPPEGEGGTVIHVDNPFRVDARRIVKLDRVVTIRQYLDDKGIDEFPFPTVARHNDTYILREDWDKTYIGKNDIVQFTTLVADNPLGGGGGGGAGKNPLKTVLLLAVILVAGAVSFGVGGLAGGLIAGLIIGGGSYLVNTIIPGPKANDLSKSWSSSGNTSTPSPTYTLNAQGNQARLGEAIPDIYGRHLVYPDYAAKPYTEFKNNDQYLYFLLCVGQGEYNIEEFRIDDTPVAYFPEITWRVVNPGEALQIVNPAVVSCEEVAGQELKAPNDLGPDETGYIGPFIVSSSNTKAGRLDFDYIWPAGLANSDASGNPTPLTLSWLVEARAIDDTGAVINGAGLASARGRVSFATNPTAGKTITLDGTVWTFVAGAAVGTQTTIGANLAATLTQLQQDLNASADVKVNKATYSIENSDLVIVHDTIGDAGQAFTLAATAGTVSRATLLGGWSKPKGSIRFATNPTPGQTLVLNGEMWTFVAAAPAVQQTLIGADLATTLASLVQDLNLSLNPTISAATYSALNSDLIIVHDTPGIAGHSFTVSSNAGTPAAPTLLNGGWSVIGSESYTASVFSQIRRTYSYNVSPERLQVRSRRLDNKSSNSFAQHVINWTATRAYLTNQANFQGVTLIEGKAKATNNLSQRTSRLFNAIVQRKLPIWDGVSWSAPQVTRSPAWAMANVCRSSYGANLPDSRYALQTLFQLAPIFEARGDYFDAVFDSTGNVWEALERIGYTVRTKPYEQNGVVQFYRDTKAEIITGMFTPRNIVKGSFITTFDMPNEASADAVIGEYFSGETWKPASVMAKLADSLAEKPARRTFFGITNKPQVYRETYYQAASNRYRRTHYQFKTELEGRIITFGDLIGITHPLIKGSKGGETIDYDPINAVLTLSEKVEFLPGNDYYIALRRRDNSLAGPFLVTPGDSEYKVQLDAPLDPLVIEPYTGDEEERTHYTFGKGYDWTNRAKIINIRPRGTQVEITATLEDDRVHDDPPPLP